MIRGQEAKASTTHEPAMTATMTNKEMTAALEDMLNKWNAAKAKAKLSHPEWSEDQINNAVGNAFTLQLVNK